VALTSPVSEVVAWGEDARPVRVEMVGDLHPLNSPKSYLSSAYSASTRLLSNITAQDALQLNDEIDNLNWLQDLLLD